MVKQLDIPVINTTRLVLEPLSMSHSPEMFDLWPDPAVCKYSGIVRDHRQRVISTPASTQQGSDRIIDFWQKAAADGWGFRWAVNLSGRQNVFVGTLGFNSRSLKDFATWQATGMLRSTVHDKGLFVKRFIELDQKGKVWKDEVYNMLVDEFNITEWSVDELLNV